MYCYEFDVCARVSWVYMFNQASERKKYEYRKIQKKHNLTIQLESNSTQTRLKPIRFWAESDYLTASTEQSTVLLDLQESIHLWRCVEHISGRTFGRTITFSPRYEHNCMFCFCVPLQMKILSVFSKVYH